MSLGDAFDLVVALPELKATTYTTPGAGRTGRPFTVTSFNEEAVTVKTSRGGRVTVRREPFQEALKVLGDLAPDDPEGWVRCSDDVLTGVTRSLNLDEPCASYVLPLLEAAGLVELLRARPAKARRVPKA